MADDEVEVGLRALRSSPQR